MITYVIILIAVIIIGIPSIMLVNKSPKFRIPFQVFFAVVIVVLGILLINNINKPIDFEKELDLRSEATIEKLIDIREIQISYKDKYNKYLADFDTLILFVKTDSFEIDNIKEVVEGSWKQDDMNKQEALDAGILVKTFSYVPVFDSIWKNKKDYLIENIRYVPFADTLQFSIDAGELVTGSKVKVKVFEAYVKYADLLHGMNEQLMVNYIDGRTKYGGFEGIKVGSLDETTNNAGNWEK